MDTQVPNNQLPHAHEQTPRNACNQTGAKVPSRVLELLCKRQPQGRAAAQHPAKPACQPCTKTRAAGHTGVHNNSLPKKYSPACGQSSLPNGHGCAAAHLASLPTAFQKDATAAQQQTQLRHNPPTLDLSKRTKPSHVTCTAVFRTRPTRSVRQVSPDSRLLTLKLRRDVSQPTKQPSLFRPLDPSTAPHQQC
jgi:hypothetical protein